MASVRTYPISSGVKGGVAGSIAMAFFCLCLRDTEGRKRLVSINLLAAVAYRESERLVPAQLYSFHADTFAIAFLCTVLSPFLLACSTAQCFPYFRVVRFYLED